MKRLTSIALLTFVVFFAQAQQADPSDAPRHLSFGYHLNNFRHDFGYGLSVTSPYFAHGNIAINASVNMAYRDGVIRPDSESTWTPYASVQAGLIGVGGMVTQSIRVYGTGGVIVLFPSAHFSSSKTAVGGYGAWGFEFIITPHITYYIELGGVGVGAKADKMYGKPTYSNGFSTTVGLKVYL